MSDTGPVLFLFTNRFPYGTESPFLVNEISTLSKRFKNVIILPYIAEGEHKREFPANVEVVYLFKPWRFRAWRTLLTYWLDFIYILFYEYRESNKKKCLLKRFSYCKSLLLQILSKAPYLEQYLSRYPCRDIYFYTYWFGEWATLLAILKKKSLIRHFITRVHGFDLYHERWADGVIPFRNFQMKWADRVFAVSRKGSIYLQSLYPRYSDKIHCSYLGVEDVPVQTEDNPSPMTILSCSSIIPLKRVHLIAEALKHCEFPLKWIHIGDGPLKNELQEKTQTLPRHIDVELKGQMTQEEIREFYRTNRANLFLHTSETEGLPVVMMEASRAGIPLMGCDVGGVSEIINEETGILLPSDVQPVEIAEEIKKFREKVKNNSGNRLLVREYWQKNFNASVNYNRFADYVLTPPESV